MCDIDFGYATIAALGKHTFLELTQTYSDGSTIVDYIEAANTDGNSSYAPPGTNPNWGYLNLWDTAKGVYSNEKTYTVTQTAASIGVYGNAICAGVDQIFARAALYAQNVNWKIQYHWYGTNSNSFTHWILDGVPSLAGFTPPSGAVGWKNDGKINQYIP